MVIVLVVLAWILGVLLALLLVALLGALLLPFEAEAAGAVAEDDGEVAAEGRFRARFAWGLVAVAGRTGEGLIFRLLGFRLRPEASAPTPEDEDEAPAAREKRKKRASRRRRRLRDFWRARGAAGRALTRFVRALHLEGELTGVVGLDDPADTATLVTLVNGLAAAQGALRVSVAPDWMGDSLALSGRLRTRFRLGAFLWVALRALFDEGVWRALRGSAVRDKRTRRRA